MTGGAPPSLDEFLASRVHIAESETVFAAFAFLNLAGYDDENNPDGMHPVRIRVRARLTAEVPPQLIATSRAYYRAHVANATTHTYAVVAMATSGPPHWAHGPEWDEIESDAKYRELSSALPLWRDFCATAPIPAMYDDVRDAYGTAIAAHRDSVRREVARAMAYCRVESFADLAGRGGLVQAVVVPNLLESHERALSFVLGDTFYSIEGPQRHPGYDPHEFLHAITNPLSYDPRVAERQRRVEPILADVGPTAAGAFRDRPVQAFLDECLVRAIALRYRGPDDTGGAARAGDALMEDYRSGFVLVRFFDEQLADYEKTRAPLRAYYPLMLRRLDPPREIDRWRRDSGSKG